MAAVVNRPSGPDGGEGRPARIVILTGAGISAESGIRTFRASDGLWEEHSIHDVATPEGFAANPELVHRFYNERRTQLLGGTVQPNAAHDALARLEREHPGRVTLITQNIDDLHARAGSASPIHMHGELLRMRCAHCDQVVEQWGTSSVDDRCATCGGPMRPHVVWFGEMPLEMDVIYAAVETCDVFAAIGTSGNVYPAAGFVAVAANAGAHTIELNLEPSEVASRFDDARYGLASVEVPRWVDEVLGAD